MMRQLKRVVTFATSLGLLTTIFSVVWGVFITDSVYNCTDAVGFDYLQPGNWVHSSVAFVKQVRAGRSMSEPDTIKEGWSVPALWALWVAFFGSSVVASAFLARVFPLQGEVPNLALHRMAAPRCRPAIRESRRGRHR